MGHHHVAVNVSFPDLHQHVSKYVALQKSKGMDDVGETQVIRKWRPPAPVSDADSFQSAPTPDTEGANQVDGFQTMSLRRNK